jgi:hypothetical protein
MSSEVQGTFGMTDTAMLIDFLILWFSLGTPVSYTTKTDCHNIAEILLKVGLNTITQS